MKILLLTPDIPYPSESGAAIRNWGIIKGLAQAGHELTLLSFSERAQDAASEPLRRRCQAVHALPLPRRSKASRLAALLASSRSDMEARLASDEFALKLRHLLRRETYDIVQFSGLELGGYLDLILTEKNEASLVYDALNAEADLQRVIARVDRRLPKRWHAMLYSSIQARRLRAFEGRVCCAVDAVIAVSEEDREILSAYRGAPITLMANGIHAADYAPKAGAPQARHQLVFTGKMDYRPNVDAVEWFCQAVLPLARRQLPDLCLTVVGRNPHPRLRALQSSGDIELTGWVESVLPYLHGAALYVVPLRMGSGTRLKLLQAMAAGCAVVSTSIGAAGLNDEARRGIVIADTAAAFAQTVLELLNDHARRENMGALARQQAKKYYDWQALLPTLLELYARLGRG